jgi:hypothetical protein
LSITVYATDGQFSTVDAVLSSTLNASDGFAFSFLLHHMQVCMGKSKTCRVLMGDSITHSHGKGFAEAVVLDWAAASNRALIDSLTSTPLDLVVAADSSYDDQVHAQGNAVELQKRVEIERFRRKADENDHNCLCTCDEQLPANCRGISYITFTIVMLSLA